MFSTKLEVDRHVENCLRKINSETEVRFAPFVHYFIAAIVTGWFRNAGNLELSRFFLNF